MFRHAAAIGADIGRNSIRIAIVRIGGEILIARTWELDRIQTRDYITAKLTEAVRETRRTAAELGINPICVGISARGFVDHRNGVVAGPDHGITDWTNVPLADIVNRETGLPAFAGNDANMMTIAEHSFGAAKGKENVVFIALRTGIGGGIIIGGRLYRGVNNAGGEIGQMIVRYRGASKIASLKGSLESLASADAMVRRFSDLSGKGNYPQLPSCREIFELSYSGHRVAMRVVRENADIIGVGIANIISIFAPEMVVIGGGMAEAEGGYLELIRESAFRNSLENCRSSIMIERALLKADSAITGAGYYSLSRLAGNTL